MADNRENGPSKGIDRADNGDFLPGHSIGVATRFGGENGNKPGRKKGPTWAPVVREWEKAGDGHGLHQSTIYEEWDEEEAEQLGRLRVDGIFRGHEALGTILKNTGQGIWALFLREYAGDTVDSPQTRQ